MSFGPKFPGEMSDHLPPKPPEPPDRWRDRFRHAWFVYLAFGFLLTLWIGSMVLLVVYLGTFGWFCSMFVAVLPAAIYFRVMQWRMLTGRDPDTGEKIPGRKRRRDS
jgi:hypothetical protein